MKLQRCCASASKAGSACWGRIIQTPSCASDGWTASAYNNKRRVAREFQRCCCAAVLCFTAAKRRQHAARAAAPTAVRRALFAIRILVAAVMHAIASPPPPTQPQQPSSHFIFFCCARWSRGVGPEEPELTNAITDGREGGRGGHAAATAANISRRGAIPAKFGARTGVALECVT